MGGRQIFPSASAVRQYNCLFGPVWDRILHHIVHIRMHMCRRRLYIRRYSTSYCPVRPPYRPYTARARPLYKPYLYGIQSHFGRIGWIYGSMDVYMGWLCGRPLSSAGKKNTFASWVPEKETDCLVAANFMCAPARRPKIYRSMWYRPG